MFEQLPLYTDCTQDVKELLLSGGSTSVSHLRSPTLSAPDQAPSHDHPISAPCDSSGGDRRGLDLDGLLLCLTGHEIPPAFPLSDALSNSLSGLNPRLSFNILNNTATAYVASDLSSTYHFTPPCIAEVQGAVCALPPCCLPLSFPAAVLVLAPPEYQHKSWFSLSRTPHRSTLSLSMSLTAQTPCAQSHCPIYPIHS